LSGNASEGAYVKARARVLVAALAAVLLLASCLPGDGKNTPEAKAGFWTGLWHGAVAPLSLVVQVFKPSIRVYEPNNKGFWYDLGFWLTIASGGGGAAAAGRSRGPRRRDRDAA
jgi:hypothetical protein